MSNPAPTNPHLTLSARIRRIRALVRKESRQIWRDPSSLALGVILPVVLILLYGYGLSLDIRNVPIAIVLEEDSPTTRNLIGGFELSPYFSPHLTQTMRTAQEWMLARKVDGILRVPSDFSRELARGDAQVQLVVHGADANHARIVEAYTQGAIATWTARRQAEGRSVAAGPVLLQTRLWFNEAQDSHYFLVPGLVVLVMTLIGAFLTALVMAREWEHGTLEALFVTPVRAEEILIGKIIPYFGLGMIGLGLCMLAAQFLFHVPFRGSIVILMAASMIYLLVALSFGLLVSSLVRSQFVASQIALLTTYLPALMLSGFLFDLRSMPAPVRAISFLVPARYYVALLQTVFLAGDVWAVILPNAAVLVAFGVLVLFFMRQVTRKSLD
ncbi:MAG: ABC transporter permease [Planctomycetota bacterium]